jgi:hypothetical protein
VDCKNCGAECIETGQEHIIGVGTIYEYKCPNGCEPDDMYGVDYEG